jgi:hypothetical protein
MRHTHTWLLIGLLCVAPSLTQADDVRERQLELDVEQLKRELQAQSRRLDQLERGSTRSTERSVSAAAQTAPLPPPKVAPWLVSANWERVRPGMTQDEVTKILGPSTAERAGNGGTTLLLYALEIQEGVFLAGRVEIQAGKVSNVQKPALR